MVPKEKQKEQVWQVALLMCKITRLLWQRSFSGQDVLELDKAIWLHDTTLLSCPYVQHLWKPKNHYLSHIPYEIVLWGPPRTYWCMNFEHANQMMKRGAAGNWANPCWSAADHKALIVALNHWEAPNV